MSRASDGLTLAETVIGLFIVTCGVLCSFQLLQLSSRYGVQVDQRVKAARIAERHLAEVRAWARKLDGNSYHFEKHPAWTERYNGASFPDPVDPDFQVRIRNLVEPVYTPCSRLEAVYPADRAKRMEASFHKVQVEVTWGPGPASHISLVSLVGAPSRPFGDLSETPNHKYQDPPLNYLERVEVEATITDPWNKEIPDVMFSHYVRSLATPGNPAGNGILDSTVSPRTGKTATMIHNYPGYGRHWINAHGQVQLQVLCRYRGVQRRAFSGYMELKP